MNAVDRMIEMQVPPAGRSDAEVAELNSPGAQSDSTKEYAKEECVGDRL